MPVFCAIWFAVKDLLNNNCKIFLLESADSISPITLRRSSSVDIMSILSVRFSSSSMESQSPFSYY